MLCSYTWFDQLKEGIIESLGDLYQSTHAPLFPFFILLTFSFSNILWKDINFSCLGQCIFCIYDVQGTVLINVHITIDHLSLPFLSLLYDGCSSLGPCCFDKQQVIPVLIPALINKERWCTQFITKGSQQERKQEQKLNLQKKLPMSCFLVCCQLMFTQLFIIQHIICQQLHHPQWSKPTYAN